MASKIGYAQADFATLITTKEPYTQKVEREARVQLNKYLQTENARRMTDLKAWLLILVGREWHLVEEIPIVRD